MGRLAALLAFSLLAGGALRAASPALVPDGISLPVGSASVELTVASDHAFRLRISYGPVPDGPASIYLAPGPHGAKPAFSIVHDGAIVGLKTSFGRILVNPATATWSLRDENGAILTNWASLGRSTASAPAPAGGSSPIKNASSGIDFSVGGSATSHPSLFYGSGSMPLRGSLTQPEGNPETGNGTTSLPQYWSNAGYGLLVVGESDGQPARWKSRETGAVDWSVPGARADLYLMPAASPGAWLRAHAELTGFAPVPPRWALGYLQSRWGWTDRAYIEDTLAHFRRDQLPLDGFIFDFEWYTTKPDYDVKAAGDPEFRDFGWNPALLPDPAEQIADYGRQGLHIVGIRKPRLGNQAALAMARARGWILPPNPLDPNGDNIRTRDLDFSNPEARAYWEENNRKFLEAGMAGFWNDEGEINYVEYSYWNLAETDLLRQVHPRNRFWSLNRSFAPGLQRFGAAAWTGDISADWATLARTPGELLSYGLAGLPYSGCDIGGFFGVGTPEMTVRWMEEGVFFPVMRSHSVNTSVPHFPWLVGTRADEDAIRKALDLRYRLLPLYDSLAHETAETGEPLMRPLVMEFSHDAQAATLANEWLMGPGLLAAPILTPGTRRSVYLPRDTWYDFDSSHITTGPQTLQVTAALDQIPIFVRAGTLLLLGPVIQYTGQATAEPLELQIYPGRDARFTLTEDDGATLGYQDGAVRRVQLTWADAGRTLRWRIQGSYEGAGIYHAMKAVLFSPTGRVEKTVSLDEDGSVSFP